MILINKETLEDIDIKEYDTLNHTKWLKYVGEPLYEGEGENMVSKFPLKYRKGVKEIPTTEVFNECSELIMLTDIEKELLNKEEEKKRKEKEEYDKFINSFICWDIMFNYKVTAPVELENPEHPLHMLSIYREQENNPQQVIRDEHFNPTHYVLFYKVIDKNILNVLLSYPDIFKVEINPKYNESI